MIGAEIGVSPASSAAGSTVGGGEAAAEGGSACPTAANADTAANATAPAAASHIIDPGIVQRDTVMPACSGPAPTAAMPPTKKDSSA